jgi:tRNA threonylcarbamoyl adenosine modification protein YeaZ
MFRQLSFDTTSSAIHLALLEDGQIIAAEVIREEKENLPNARRQEVASLLIPSIARLMSEVGWSKEQLDCLVVGTGPGGFTSIRIAVVAGRTLAQALRLPLLPVSLLEAYSSLIEGFFIIALKATADHFFLAKPEAGKTCAYYVRQKDISEFVPEHAVIYADSRAKPDLIDLRKSESFLINCDIKELPSLSNIAAQQGICAWHRISSQVKTFYKRLPAPSSDNEDGRDKSIINFRKELFQEFGYELVAPTYLRAPSITLKKANV